MRLGRRSPCPFDCLGRRWLYNSLGFCWPPTAAPRRPLQSLPPRPLIVLGDGFVAHHVWLNVTAAAVCLRKGLVVAHRVGSTVTTAAVCIMKIGSLATNGYSSPATPVTATAAAVGMLQLFRCTHLDCLAVTAVAVCMV